MHAVDMMGYGHSFFMDALNGLDQSHVEDHGVCGDWSAKDVVGHIGASEGLLVDILNQVLGNTVPTPFFDAVMKVGPLQFNDDEADKRKGHSYQQVLDEYQTAFTNSIQLLKGIPLEQQREKGLLAWYGDAYDLEDYLVYSYYAHKREHGAQINILKDRTKG